jgi:hypothetical protein
MFAKSIKFAWRGSISRSNAWAPLGGALLLWAALYAIGVELAIPDKLPGAAAVFVMCVACAWIIIFIGRLLYAPYAEINTQGAQLLTATETLSRISEDRPLTYVTTTFNALGNDFHQQQPTWRKGDIIRNSPDAGWSEPPTKAGEERRTF